MRFLLIPNEVDQAIRQYVQDRITLATATQVTLDADGGATVLLEERKAPSGPTPRGPSVFNNV